MMISSGLFLIQEMRHSLKIGGGCKVRTTIETEEEVRVREPRTAGLYFEV